MINALTADRRAVRPRRRVPLGPLVAITWIALAGCSIDSPATAPRLSPRGAPNLSVTDITLTPILWNEGTLGTGGHVHPYLDFRAADDFVVPAGGTWQISEMLFTGRIFASNGAAPQATITIYNDDGGLPGTVVQSYTLAPTDSEPAACSSCADQDYLFTLSTPLTLSAGTYWFALSAPENIQLSWDASAQVVGSPAVTGYESTPWSSIDPAIDFTFMLYGTDGTPADAAQDLQATLASFGLDGGTFTSLNAKLRAVVAAINAGDTAAACSALRDFVNQVNALTGKKLTDAQAATLIDAANQLAQSIGC